MKKVIIIALLLVLLVLPCGAFAAANSTVTSFDVDIVVHENNTYDVTERILQDYSAPSHGMYRTIPLRQQIAWQKEDGTFINKTQVVQVEDIRVSEQFEQTREGGNMVLKIGDPESTVTGEKEYTITYHYNAGDDGFDAFDQFYFNIVGPEWEMPVRDVSFRIEMPKDFDTSKVGFNAGDFGVGGYDTALLTFDVEGNVITGHYSGTVDPGQALSIRVELPQGYFVGASVLGEQNMQFALVSILMLAAVFVLFLVFRRKKKPLRTVEFYPPEGMTPADVGFIVDGTTDDRDVLALFIYWADKGYIEIDAPRQEEMTFIKKMDLPEEANEYEQLMFLQLFLKGDICKLDDLKYSFYDTLQATKTRIKMKFEEEKNRVFKKGSQMLQDLAAMLAAFPVAAMAGIAMHAAWGSMVATIIMAAIVFLVGYGVTRLFIGFVRGMQSERRSKQAGQFILWIVLTVALDALVMFLCYWFFDRYIWVAPLCALGMTLMTPFFTKRTEKGLYWQGRILGLREFILQVELDKLNMLVEEDPQYFYHILPYAYVLGLTDRWAKQFEALAVPPPSWYYGDGWTTFSTVYFTGMLMRNMMFVQMNAAVKPMEDIGGRGNFPGGFGGGSGGGGFSGGGFSGGGFGGGGGGTW